MTKCGCFLLLLLNEWQTIFLKKLSDVTLLRGLHTSSRERSTMKVRGHDTKNTWHTKRSRMLTTHKVQTEYNRQQSWANSNTVSHISKNTSLDFAAVRKLRPVYLTSHMALACLFNVTITDISSTKKCIGATLMAKQATLLIFCS